ncbi:hypothetical protein DFJ74DRAFT_773829 [Hyaloraphidium curvatum]|nr:hypothetical protein DFJ74DRAFT_773829 [Hyaloraphidium curvatum]
MVSADAPAAQAGHGGPAETAFHVRGTSDAGCSAGSSAGQGTAADPCADGDKGVRASRDCEGAAEGAAARVPEGPDAGHAGRTPDGAMPTSPDRPPGRLSRKEKLPSEVLECIAGFLRPGSRALLNMSLMSRAAFRLLMPRFLATVEVVRMRHGCLLEQFLGDALVSGKFDCVRSLRMTGHWPSELALLRRCRRLRRLECHYGNLAVLDALPCEHLSSLDVSLGVGFDLPPTFSLSLPSLRRLAVRGRILPEFQAAVARGCPHLESVDAEFDGDDGWEPHASDLVPAFLAKVEHFRFHDAELLVAACRWPAFRPACVSDASHPGACDRTRQGGRLWAALLGLGSLRRAQLNGMPTDVFLLGFPAGAEEVSLSRAKFALGKADLAEAGKALKAADGRLVPRAMRQGERPVLRIGVEPGYLVEPHAQGGALDWFAELEFWTRMGGVQVYALGA